ncbi:MAG: SMI1/KNR4 family protein [Bacillota bacterium]
MGKWLTLYSELLKDHDYIKVNPPATKQQIDIVEKELGNTLPSDIKEFLSEMNGDSWFVFSAEQILENNLSCRDLHAYCMPLDCIVFFAGNGCGDYLGYPVTSEGVRSDRVYLWEHETDDRIWKANDLEDAIRKYYHDEI